MSTQSGWEDYYKMSNPGEVDYLKMSPPPGRGGLFENVHPRWEDNMKMSTMVGVDYLKASIQSGKHPGEGQRLPVPPRSVGHLRRRAAISTRRHAEFHLRRVNRQTIDKSSRRCHWMRAGKVKSNSRLAESR